MKKILIILAFLLFIPNINASTYKNNIYDESNLFDENEYDRLDEKIKEFELKSSIDLKIITTSSIDEFYQQEEIEEKYKKIANSIYLPEIILIYDEFGELKINTNSDNDIWKRDRLKRFKLLNLNGKEAIYISSIDIDTLIQTWIDYYELENLKLFILIIILSTFATIILMRIITKKYRPKIIREADKYIQKDKIIVK